MSVHLSVHLSVCLFVGLLVYLLVCSSICLFVCQRTVDCGLDWTDDQIRSYEVLGRLLDLIAPAGRVLVTFVRSFCPCWSVCLPCLPAFTRASLHVLLLLLPCSGVCVCGWCGACGIRCRAPQRQSGWVRAGAGFVRVSDSMGEWVNGYRMVWYGIRA